MLGMLIERVENGFMVTETPEPHVNLFRPARHWVFRDFSEVEKFVGDHFAGDNEATLPPVESLPQVGSGILGQAAQAGIAFGKY